MKPSFQPNYTRLIPFALMHVACLAVFFVPFSWQAVGLCLGLCFLRMFGITAGYHRYFSHRSFKTSRSFQFLLALIANLSLMRGPISWAAHHRYHHRYSDKEQDLHSPQKGFWWSHMLWFLDRNYSDAPPQIKLQDLERYPELRWLNQYYALPAYALAVGLFVWGNWAWVAWGFALSTTLTWHLTFCINSLSHVWGYQVYATSDTSRNNWLLALLTLGEGWHNNHHFAMSSARQGFYWWEIDLCYYLLYLLKCCGLVWDLHPPPQNWKERRLK